MTTTLHLSDGPPSRHVRFPPGDTHVSALLFEPVDARRAQRHPAVVVGGSMTAVKEQMVGIHAGALALRGFVALAVDYRHYGESGGTPRQYEDPDAKADDLAAAVAFLQAQSSVDADRIAALGVCTSGGTVLYAARRDPRLGAIACVASHLAEPAITPALYGGEEGVAARLRAADQARARFETEGVTELIQAYSNVNATASHPGPHEYYMDQTRGGGVPQWLNAFAVMAWRPWLDFDPISEAAHVSTPTLIVHTDDCALPDQARKAYDLLAGERQLHWTTGAHFDFYDQSPKVNEAADLVANHFHDHLR
jgi:fermentation-respiration switch protein FrsA (DUF1100 family)